MLALLLSLVGLVFLVPASTPAVTSSYPKRGSTSWKLAAGTGTSSSTALVTVWASPYRATATARRSRSSKGSTRSKSQPTTTADSCPRHRFGSWTRQTGTSSPCSSTSRN